MRWEVSGADGDSGADITIIFDAPSRESAAAKANAKGILVSEIRPIGATPVVRAAPSSPTAPFRAPPPPMYVPAQHINVGVAVRSGHKGTSGFGIAALILGVIAILFCWVPFVGLLALPIAGFGTMLAVVGFVVSAAGGKSSVGMPVAGGTICILAICGATLMSGATAKSIADASAPLNRNPPHQEVITSPPSIAPATPEPRPAPTPAPSPPVIEWAPATATVKLGDIQVRLLETMVGKKAFLMDYGDGHGDDEKENKLYITVQITNVSQLKKIDYRSWREISFGFGEKLVSLKDSEGNDYSQKGYNNAYPEGAVNKYATLYPGRSVTDIIVFERPVDGVKFLYLELPASNAHAGDGSFKFQIPMSAVAGK